MSLRLPDDLAADVRAHAARSGRSVNGWIAAVLAAAVDPDLAGSDAERVRERLRRAGLLATSQTTGRKPDARAVARARRAAGGGATLEALVTDTRR
jgi:plasmid stability protein